MVAWTGGVCLLIGAVAGGRDAVPAETAAERGAGAPADVPRSRSVPRAFEPAPSRSLGIAAQDSWLGD